MLAVFACLAAILLLLVLSELLNRSRILKGEYHRKFFHITAGSFIAFWPWLMSWHTLQILGLLMILFVLANWRLHIFNYHGNVKRRSYGVLLLAVAIFLCSFLAGQKIFFTLAILQVALADGLAAVVGKAYSKDWRYKVLGQPKTVVGSMVFWVVSVCVLAGGILLSPGLPIVYNNYALILVTLPPLLTELENIAVFGADNLLIPLATILVLRLAQS